MDKGQRHPEQKDEMNGKGRNGDQAHNLEDRNNQPDISKIDRQEGNMEHGETGDRQKQQKQEKS